MSETPDTVDTSDSAKIRRLVSEYCNTQRHPNLSPFVVHGLFDADDIWSAKSVGKPGCYVIYDIDRRLHYIGMSKVNIGNRIRRHLSPSVQKSQYWKERPPKYFDIIEVAYAWEPLSLEEYLTITMKR